MNDDELPPSATNSSELFGSEDSSFIAALANAVLPGDVVENHSKSHSVHSNEEVDSSLPQRNLGLVLTPPPNTQVPTTGRKRRLSNCPELDDKPRDSRHVPKFLTSGGGSSYMDSHTYGAAHFGDFGEYMSRKRAKLLVQNTELDDANEDSASAETRKRQIFKGLAIYVRFITILSLT